MRDLSRSSYCHRCGEDPQHHYDDERVVQVRSSQILRRARPRDLSRSGWRFRWIDVRLFSRRAISDSCFLSLPRDFVCINFRIITAHRYKMPRKRWRERERGDSRARHSSRALRLWNFARLKILCTLLLETRRGTKFNRAIKARDCLNSYVLKIAVLRMCRLEKHSICT